MAVKKNKRREQHAFIRKGKHVQITIPPNIADEVEIKDKEKPRWETAIYKSEEKTLKIRISRGESIYDD